MSGALERTRYFLDGLISGGVADRCRCPSCGSTVSQVVERKWIVTAVRRCGQCQLLFRTPTSLEARDKKFYARRYRQGPTTSLPSPAQLSELQANSFSGINKNYDHYMSVIEALGARPGADLLDFGCSWGYGAWQFSKRGYQVKAFDLPGPRTEFARKSLNVDVVSSLDAIESDRYDVFFSSHVLEHLPSVSTVIRAAMRSLRPGGLFVAFVPNGSLQRRAKTPELWSKSWGLVHPNLIDEQFAATQWPTQSMIVASNPYDLQAFRVWASDGTPSIASLEGEELMIAARK